MGRSVERSVGMSKKSVGGGSRMVVLLKRRMLKRGFRKRVVEGGVEGASKEMSKKVSSVEREGRRDLPKGVEGRRERW